MGRRRRGWAIGVAAVVVALTATAVGLHLLRVRHRQQDARICRAAAQLDGVHYDPAVVRRIRAAGVAAPTTLGRIARHADLRSLPGRLSLTSEDLDYLIVRCDELHVDVPHPA